MFVGDGAMKKYFSGLLTGIILMIATAGFSASQIKSAYYNPDIKVRVNGTLVDSIPITVIDEGQQWGKNFTGVRDIAEALGATVSFDPGTKVITVSSTPEIDVARNTESCVMIRAYKSGKYVAYGSGIVHNGYIITCKHVLDQGTQWDVIYDGSSRAYEAERVSINTTLDIGILKSPKGVKSVTLGDSDKVVVGEKVILISSPRESKNTVSEGIVSAIRESNNTKLFRTTTNASPGSSGGALFNTKGQLIGVLSNGWEGEKLNLAIQINDIKTILNKLD